MAKPTRGGPLRPSGSGSSSRSRSRSRSYSGSDSRSSSRSRSLSSGSRSRSRSRSFTSSSSPSRSLSSGSRSPPAQKKSPAEVLRRGRSPPPQSRKTSPPPRKTSPIRNFGEVVHVELAMDRTVNLPKGYGYVELRQGLMLRRPYYTWMGFFSSETSNLTSKKIPPCSKRWIPKTSSRFSSTSTCRFSSCRRIGSPYRHGDTPPRRRPASPARGRSPSPPRRYRSPARGSPRRIRGSPVRRRSPPPPRRRTPPRRARSPQEGPHFVDVAALQFVGLLARVQDHFRQGALPSNISQYVFQFWSSMLYCRGRAPAARRGRSSSYSGSPSPRRVTRRISRSRSPRSGQTILIIASWIVCLYTSEEIDRQMNLKSIRRRKILFKAFRLSFSSGNCDNFMAGNGLPLPSLGRVKLSDLIPSEGLPSESYKLSVSTLSESLAQYSAAIIQFSASMGLF
ncbi:hypothetical protein GH714_001406 [Hevea brasiliensis]|uniref:Uncharacterized protein n=1 Tax=Hevea brasiliensis TaxID=3981 RepID=A0A6A6MBA5_HEVBR|nr:hypothetical protein GH714_001406 [Hevea brasiliensis]